MELAIYLTMGTFAMASVMLLARVDYVIPVWKTLALSVLLTLSGYAGAKLMAFIEMGNLLGVSFYGAVFFAPIIMILAALIFRVRILTILDMCAPAECIMLAVLKVKCFDCGCCYGKTFEISGESVVFPSQLVELLNGLILTFVLLILVRYGKNRGGIYPWYMILYGITRFILNLFRETTPFVWILPAGNFWSILSIAVGVCWLVLMKCKRKKDVA